MKARGQSLDAKIVYGPCAVKGTVGRGLSPGVEELEKEIVECTRCPRLVKYREHVAHVKRAQFRDWEYWGRPLPGFGDPAARMLVVGLAPAAHGGNRTGRMFTGDRSGDWLFRALYRAGFANQPESMSRDDGLMLRDCFISAAIRCAPPGNRPMRTEFARCQPFLERELNLLSDLRVVVVLGQLALDAFLRAWKACGHEVPVPKPKFHHGSIISLPPLFLVISYHPSQRNTSTGKLNEGMFDDVFRTARARLNGPIVLSKNPANSRPIVAHNPFIRPPTCAASE